MKEVIERYKTLIWIWSIVNLTALAVSVFDIYGRFSNGYLLTRPGNDTRDFYPFVKIFETYDGPVSRDQPTIWWNGIFYGYDITEFLFYMGILAAFLTYKAYVEKKSTVI